MPGDKQVDKLRFHIRVPPVGGEKGGGIGLKPQFFQGFAFQRVFNSFSRVNMAAHGRIPFPGLDPLGSDSFLQENPILIINDMQVDHRVQHARVAMADRTGSRSNHFSRFIHQVEPLVMRVFPFPSGFNQAFLRDFKGEKTDEDQVKEPSADERPGTPGQEKRGICGQRGMEKKDHAQGPHTAAHLQFHLLGHLKTAHVPAGHHPHDVVP